MLTLGLDPGLALTGYGLVGWEGEALRAIEYGVISTPASEPPAQRLQLLYGGLRQVISRHRLTEVAVEQLFFSRNARTALAVGQARGVALLAVADAGLPVSEYTPLQVKRAIVGYGRGTKHQIQQMVRILLGLKEVPQPDDAADALAVAICHLHSARFSQLLSQSG